MYDPIAKVSMTRVRKESPVSLGQEGKVGTNRNKHEESKRGSEAKKQGVRGENERGSTINVEREKKLERNDASRECVCVREREESDA